MKVPVYFQTINVDAAKNKINEFSSSPECSLTQEEQATLGEVYGQLKLPSVASLDSGFSENFNPATLLAIAGKWPEDKRFPCEQLCFPHRPTARP